LWVFPLFPPRFLFPLFGGSVVWRGLFAWKTGTGLKGLRVIRRDQVENQGGNVRMGGGEGRFGAASALLEVKPDYGRILVCLHSLGNFYMHGQRQPQHCCHRCAGFHEVPAGDPGTEKLFFFDHKPFL